jgi:hypothetical protein
MSSDDERTTALLQAVAERAPSGPAPVAAVTTRVRRDRAVRAGGAVLVAGLLAAGAVPAASLLRGPAETAPERLVSSPEPSPSPTPAALQPSLAQLRPTGPRPDLVVEGGPVAEVYLDSVGGARTDPVDPSLLVVRIPAGQAGSGPQDAGRACWSGATARASADGDVVRLEPLVLLNARPPVQPSLPPGTQLLCNASLGSTQVLVQLPGPLEGRRVVLPGGRVLEVGDGRLLPVARALPEGWVFRGSGGSSLGAQHGAVRYESRSDRTVAADLHAGEQLDPGALEEVDRFEVAPGREAVVTRYGPLGFRVGWSDDAGPLWADVAGLPLADVRALVRSVVRAGDAYR